MIPLGDTPNPVKKPAVTWLLIAANVAIYVFVSLPRERPLTRAELGDPAVKDALEQILDAQDLRGVEGRQVLAELSAYDVFVQQHGYKPGDADLADLLFCMFLHANLAHLLGNMLFLWIYGDNVEARLGPLLYLLAYLATGVIATWSFSAMAGGSLVPLVGASGAISGVLGFYAVWFPKNRVKLFFYLGPLWWDVIYLPAFLVLLGYLVLDNLLPFALSSVGSGVAYGAHIGGFVAGAVAAFLLKGSLPMPEMQPERFTARRRRYHDAGWY